MRISKKHKKPCWYANLVLLLDPRGEAKVPSQSERNVKMKIAKICFKSSLTENKKAENIVPFTNGFEQYDSFVMAIYKSGMIGLL